MRRLRYAYRQSGDARVRTVVAATSTRWLTRLRAAITDRCRSTLLDRTKASVAMTVVILLLGLPITALLIAVVFTWVQDEEAVRRQLGETVVVPIVKYVVPAVLIVVTGLRLVTGVDFSAWRRLPGREFMEPVLRIEVTLAVLAIVVIAAWVMVRYVGSGRRGKSERR